MGTHSAVEGPDVHGSVVNGRALRHGLTDLAAAGGALGLPAFGVAGAYAFAGRRRWARVAGALLALAPVPIWVLTAPSFGGPSLSITDPKGAGVAPALWSFLAVLMGATAIPLRIPPGRQAGSRDAFGRRPGHASSRPPTPNGQGDMDDSRALQRAGWAGAAGLAGVSWPATCPGGGR